MNKKKIISLCVIIPVVLICIGLVIYFVFINLQKNTEEVEESEYVFIDLRENLSKRGEIKGLENVTWDYISINQNESSTMIDFMLNNNSETEKVEAKDITVKLFDKYGNEVLSKNAQIDEIPANGYKSMHLKCENVQFEIIYDVQIIAK